jgi:hypothetical protein
MEHILEILHNLWYGPDIEGLIKAEPLITAGLIMGGASLLGSVFGGIGAGKRARRAAAEKRRLQGKLEGLENSRQPIINPYSDVTSLQGFITDTSNIASNPYANLSVATQAAEFEAEEADIALANTLDTLMATGASAGGATALAQAALKSKRGVSADIERQEAQNEQLKAQGQQAQERLQMAEAQRVQTAQMGEAGRMQQANVLGKEFVYGQKERRETERMNRVQSQITGQAQQEANYRSQQASMFGGAMNTVGGMGMTFTTSSRFKIRIITWQTYQNFQENTLQLELTKDLKLF